MTRLLWVVAIALFAVRMTDGHLHLCLDGQEPPLAMHAEEGGDAHPSPHADGAHEDLDVPVVAKAMPKKAEDSSTPDPFLPLAAGILLPVARRPRRVPVRRARSLLLPPAPLFLPPARAPPR